MVTQVVSAPVEGLGTASVGGSPAWIARLDLMHVHDVLHRDVPLFAISYLNLNIPSSSVTVSLG